jgi:hypothetical protein
MRRRKGSGWHGDTFRHRIAALKGHKKKKLKKPFDDIYTETEKRVARYWKDIKKTYTNIINDPTNSKIIHDLKITSQQAAVAFVTTKTLESLIAKSIITSKQAAIAKPIISSAVIMAI